MHTYTTQQQIRAAFWDAHPTAEAEARRRGTKSKGHNAQTADTRTAFCLFLNDLAMAGHISDRLADRATL